MKGKLHPRQGSPVGSRLACVCRRDSDVVKIAGGHLGGQRGSIPRVRDPKPQYGGWGNNPLRRKPKYSQVLFWGVSPVIRGMIVCSLDRVGVHTPQDRRIGRPHGSHECRAYNLGTQKPRIYQPGGGEVKRGNGSDTTMMQCHWKGRRVATAEL